jgi:hypothetical protein
MNIFEAVALAMVFRLKNEANAQISGIPKKSQSFLKDSFFSNVFFCKGKLYAGKKNNSRRFLEVFLFRRKNVASLKRQVFWPCHWDWGWT